MKKIKPLLLLFLIVAFLGCSKDDAGISKEDPKNGKISKLIASVEYVNGYKLKNENSFIYGNNGYIKELTEESTLTDANGNKTVTISSLKCTYNTDNKITSVNLEVNANTDYVTSFAYEGNRIIKSSTAYPDKSYIDSTRYFYDAKNNVSKVIEYSRYYAKESFYTYDSNNNLIKKIVSQENSTSNYEYDTKKNYVNYLFPAAYLKIEIGNVVVGNNNNLVRSIELVNNQKSIEYTNNYIYNDDDYPAKNTRKTTYYNNGITTAIVTTNIEYFY